MTGGQTKQSQEHRLKPTLQGQVEGSRDIIAGMENKQIARILRETARLLEIDGAIIGRYRSYEKAAELIDGLPESVEQLVATPEKLTELPGIGERMVEHLTGDCEDRRLRAAEEAAEEISGDDSGFAGAAIAGAEEGGGAVEDILRRGRWRTWRRLAKEGKLRDLAGFGEKSEQNILKAVEVFKKVFGEIPYRCGGRGGGGDYRRTSRRWGKRWKSVTPAGSLRRGKETVGDLDLLVTLAEGHTKQKDVDAVAKHILTYPGIDQTLAHGENKVSFTLENGLQVDVRLLEKENFGAALLYFTGSKEHNVALRGRANEMGYTLNEYALATLKGEKRVARPDGGGDLRKVEAGFCSAGVAGEHGGDRGGGKAQVAETD